MSDTPNVPKAILYAWPTSVWSTVPQLCLVEKGYSEDEYIIKSVDITRGENFSPSYLKINLNGTIPTLVVPQLETTGDGVNTRYRSLRDTTTICNFLDQARSAGTTNTVSDKPAPALAPATIEGKTVTDQITQLVHLPQVDPNFLNMSARDAHELKVKAARAPGKMLSARREAIRKHMEDAKIVAAMETAGVYEKKMVQFLEDKALANEALWTIYNGQAGEEKEKAFFDASVRTWTVEIPAAFARLEELINGPFVLGDQISLGDLHLISWLTRLITIAPGPPTAQGIDALESQLGGKKIGPKLRTFWASWIHRESFKKVLVASADAFTEAAGNEAD